MKKILWLLALLSTTTLSAQQTDHTESTDRFQFLVRGKALGFVIIEDLWVRSFSIGGEVKLNEQFSLVVDLVHFRWRPEREVYELPGSQGDYDEFSQYDARNYLAFELRYYPQFLRFGDQFMPYVNVFSKVGRRKIWTQDKYPLMDQEVFQQNGVFHDWGISLGFQTGRPFGFDCNIGAAYRTEFRDELIHQIDSPDVLYRDDVHEYRWVPNIRVNFYWNIGA